MNDDWRTDEDLLADDISAEQREIEYEQAAELAAEGTDMEKEDRDVLFQFQQAMGAVDKMRYRWIQAQPAVRAAWDAVEKACAVVRAEDGWDTDVAREEADREALWTARGDLQTAEEEAAQEFHGWLACHASLYGQIASGALRQFDHAVSAERAHESSSPRSSRNEDFHADG